MTKSDDEKFKKTIQKMLNTKPDPKIGKKGASEPAPDSRSAHKINKNRNRPKASG